MASGNIHRRHVLPLNDHEICVLLGVLSEIIEEPNYSASLNDCITTAKIHTKLRRLLGDHPEYSVINGAVVQALHHDRVLKPVQFTPDLLSTVDHGGAAHGHAAR